MDALQHYRGGAKEHQFWLLRSSGANKSENYCHDESSDVRHGLGNVMATAAERSMRCPDKT
jgi:hypothetical protein